MKTTNAKNAQPAIITPISAVGPEDIENLTRIMAQQRHNQRGRQPGRDLDGRLAEEKDLAEKTVIDRKGEKDLKSNLKIG